MSLTVDASEFKAFFNQLGQAANGQFKQDMATYLDAVAVEFLDSVKEIIVSHGNVITTLLLNSFSKGGEGNVFEVESGGLLLEVGTTVNYAQYVNFGHSQEPGRFIPGFWEGDRFTYSPGYPGGMVLKASWVDGSHFWDEAVARAQTTVPEDIRAKVEEWIEQYLGG